MKRIKEWLRFLVLVTFVAFAGVTSVVGDSQDINDKLIATTISVDRKDGEIWIYVEFANIAASGGSSGSSESASEYFLVKSHGKTFVEARANLDRQLDMPIYLGGTRTVLITERFAEEDLVEYLYRLRADETYRKKVITITTRDDLDALYKAMNEQKQSVGYSIENMIKSLDSSGDCSLRTTSRLLENLSDTYTGILIPCVGLQDKEIAFTGYSVVSDTKSVGFIPVEECRGLNMLKASMAETHYVIPYGDGNYTVKTTLEKRKIAAEYKDGRADFTFELSFEATVEYGDTKTPYGLTEADDAQLTELVKQYIIDDLLTAFNQAQNVFRTDYLQCDDVFRVKYPNVYETLDWGETFAQAGMTASVNVNLLSTYMLDYSENVAR